MLKEKLNSEKGATLLFALAAMAIAVAVSSAVLLAAETNARQAKAGHTAEQNRLALNAAAALVRREILGSDGKYFCAASSETYVKATVRTPEGTIVEYPAEPLAEETGAETEYGKLLPADAGQQKAAIPPEEQTLLERFVAACTEEAFSGESPHHEDTLQKCFVVEGLGDGLEGKLPPVEILLVYHIGGNHLAGQSEAFREEKEAEKYLIDAEISLADGQDSAALRLTFQAEVTEERDTRQEYRGVEELSAQEQAAGVLQKETAITRIKTEIRWTEAGMLVNRGW